MPKVLGMEKSDPGIDMLKDIGLQIIEKCDGLPLAIKVMGGLLCQKEKERRDWERYCMMLYGQNLRCQKS